MMKLIVFIRLPVTRAAAPASAPAPDRAPASNATLWPLVFQLLLLPPLVLPLLLLTHCDVPRRRFPQLLQCYPNSQSVYANS